MELEPKFNTRKIYILIHLNSIPRIRAVCAALFSGMRCPSTFVLTVASVSVVVGIGEHRLTVNGDICIPSINGHGTRL